MATIEYSLTENKLTSPPSYSARPNPKSILGYDRLSEQINLRNPTIPTATAKSVLEAFREEVKFQILEGNTINLEGFISFVASMPVKLLSPVDPLPENPLDIKAKPSVVLKTDIRTEATFSRLPYVEKAPQILEVVDADSNVEGWMRPGYALELNGSNIGFEYSETGDAYDHGVWLKYMQTDAETKMTNIPLNDPSRVMVIPPALVITPNVVEYEAKIVTRYTENGQKRTGLYSKFLRTTNEIDNPNAEVMKTLYNGGNPATITAYAGIATGIMVGRIKTNGDVVLSFGEVGGEQGPEVTVTPTTTQVVLTGDDLLDLTVDIDDYDELLVSLNWYSKYMTEVCFISEAIT